MGYSSQDNLTAEVSSGKYLRAEGSKLTSPAHTAGGWHLLVGNAGSPNAGTFPGSSLAWVGCNESTGDGTTIIGQQHGGNPGGTATKHLLSVGASLVAAAGAPWQAKLVDLIGYYKLTGTDVTGTGIRTLTGTPTHRYGNGDGVQACIVSVTAPTAGGPNVSASSYTNAGGTATRAFQGSPSCGAAADAYATRVLHSGNAAGRYGPFLPLQGGDTGVRSIQSITLSGGTAYTGSGVLAICLVKPLADISIPVAGMWSERDLVNQLASLPKIADGACLAWMLFSTGATTNNSPFTYALDIGWAG
jgi:hypothetical protein